VVTSPATWPAFDAIHDTLGVQIRMPLDSVTSPASLPFAPSLSSDVGRRAAVRVLIVDEEDPVRHVLVRFLRERGYDVQECASGPAALSLLQRERFVVLLSEVRLPGMSGLDVVSRALELDRNLAVVMLTAVNEASAATEALTRGALDYLVKPVALPSLHLAIVRAIYRRQLETDRRNVERRVRDEVVLRTMELEREKAALHGLTIGIAETLINAMEAKDVYLRGHSRRVAEQAASVAEEMGLDADLVEHVRLSGRLHDIGKIGIREDILNKPGALTAEEYAHVQEHVRIGMEILAPLSHIPEALEFIHDHHERFDGSGYPRGRVGSEISIGGRILAACDAFDAMTSRRAFREAFDEQATIGHLEADVGRLLDPAVFAALRRVVVRRKTLPFIDDLHA
jgi:putative two-component system response regulator